MLKNTYIWLPGYIKQLFTSKLVSEGPTHVIFCLVDHFEPAWNRASQEMECCRVDAWIKKYTDLAKVHKDSDGKPPKYTIFYPQEEYRKEHLSKLSKVCNMGYVEVEAHLHHDNDTAAGLKEKIENFKAKLVSHGMLARDNQGAIRYGFIHGNWSLDNSRKDGRWCGVDNELEVLRDTGCYADFTLPSAPSDTQTGKINSIYYAKDTPKPKSHNTGIDVEVGAPASGDLMIVQGPLTLNWKRRKFGVIPRIENSEITFKNPPTTDRVALWVDQRIGVIGRPEWIFIKVHTHGLQDTCLKDEHFSNLGRMLDHLEEKYNDGIKYKLHYVTARELFNIIKAAEDNKTGNPGQYRDYLLTNNILKDCQR